MTAVDTAVDMRTALGSVQIPGPVLTASGCSAFGQELEPFVDLTALGAVVTKSVQLRPRSGRPTPRMAETPSGMLNSIGLQGPGIDGLLAEDLPWLAERGARAFVSIAGTRVEDFAELAARLRGVPGVLGLEVNISCPNVESRGEVFACDPVAASDVIGAVRAAADPAQPIYAKLSPDVTDIVVGRPRGRRRRCRRAVDDQHAARAGDRPRHHAPGARRGDRRPVGAGDPAGGAALRLAGARGDAGGARSSAWAASGTGWTPCSSSWRAPRPSPSGRRSSTTPRRPPGSTTSSPRRWPRGASPRCAEAVGYAHRAAGVER